MLAEDMLPLVGVYPVQLHENTELIKVDAAAAFTRHSLGYSNEEVFDCCCLFVVDFLAVATLA